MNNNPVNLDFLSFDETRTTKAGRYYYIIMIIK